MNRGEVQSERGPIVLISPEIGQEDVIEQAREWGWECLDLRWTAGRMPEDPFPAGAIVSELPTAPLVKLLRERGCPVVRLGRWTHPDDAKVPAVLPDYQRCGHLAAEHFKERGFQDVGYVGRIPWGPFRSMYDAFQQRAEELGMRCHLHRMVSGFKPGESEGRRQERVGDRAKETADWLHGLPYPVGVFIFNDWQAAGVGMLCREEGLQVPEQVAILGTGNGITVCEMTRPNLSSVDTGEQVLRQEAMLLLRDLMAGNPKQAQPVMVQPQGIVTRRSTDVLAVSDPIVMHAMRFMWDHIAQDLSVDDIAKEVGVNRRQLERAFRHHLGRGVHGELRRRRLQRCCDMLRATDMPVTDIAALNGFRSDSYLYQSFKRAFGTTPRKYRQKHRARTSRASGMPSLTAE